eukprot:TRINITY_DN1240_c0_g1_i1.p1 TRINITY_DN1240_c0_g1~~TRINITY_DN1240_c0_g1_i1.p1  ORF type:complete len:547 (+),score=181.33 TRINITY_DN1240_c0_g1_i1:75-1643(+)
MEPSDDFIPNLLSDLVDTIIEELMFEHQFHQKLNTMHPHLFNDIDSSSSSSSSSHPIDEETDHFLTEVLSSDESSMEETLSLNNDDDSDSYSESTKSPNFSVFEIMNELHGDDDVEKWYPTFARQGNDEGFNVTEGVTVPQKSPYNCGHHALYNSVTSQLIALSSTKEEALFWGKRMTNKTAFWFQYWKNMKHIGRKSMLKRYNSGILERSHLQSILILEQLINLKIGKGRILGFPEASRGGWKQGFCKVEYIKNLNQFVKEFNALESTCCSIILGTMNHWVSVFMGKIDGKKELVMYDSRQYWLLCRDYPELNDLVQEVCARHPYWKPFHKDVFVQGLQDIGWNVRFLNACLQGQITDVVSYALDAYVGQIVDDIARYGFKNKWNLPLMSDSLPDFNPWERSLLEKEEAGTRNGETEVEVVDAEGHDDFRNQEFDVDEFRMALMIYQHPSMLSRDALYRIIALGTENASELTTKYVNEMISVTKTIADEFLSETPDEEDVLFQFLQFCEQLEQTFEQKEKQ